MLILAGDIGGTNTRIALFDAVSPTQFDTVREEVFSSENFDGLEKILQQFLSHSTTERIGRACLGIAGPVIDQVCDATNLPWRISAEEIRNRFEFDAVWLLNDLEANAWGIEALPDEDIYQIAAGSGDAKGNRSIISAGTGLGEAGIYWDGNTYRPFPSEGGHSDFSPTTPMEFALYAWLSVQYDHVSWERVVSGPGLENLFRFLLQYREQPTPEWVSRLKSSDDLAPAISETAMEGTDPVAVEALDLFLKLYGREAGNHALKLMATGGVYLGGGLAPKVLSRLDRGDFLAAFLDKGRMRPLMESMPVRVILNDKAALLGAARFARLQ